MSGHFRNKVTHISLRFIRRKNKPGPIFRPCQSPQLVSLPPRNRPHIPGSLDLVAPGAEHLEIPRIPLVPTYGYRHDMVQDPGMPAISSPGFWDLPPAPGTFPLLLEEDKSPHLTNGGPVSAPVHRTARRLTAEGIPSGRKIRSLAATDRAGSPGKALLLFRGIGIPAVFTRDHLLVLTGTTGMR
jgi:hypothetical protein